MLKYLALLILLMLIPSVNAIEYQTICLSNTTLSQYANFTSCERTSTMENCTYYNFSQIVPCNYGCDSVTSKCKDAPYITYLEIIAVIIIVILILAWVIKR
jgi:hypothetical protein